jgi:glycerol-3-phosphate acyltransferase PlsY
MMTAAGILIGYLLGSVNPAWILGRALRGADIRRRGTGNAGTWNDFAVPGSGPAAVTAVFDLATGLAAMAVAARLGAPPWGVYAAGYAAVLGHVFPFYLRFRGGAGSATCVGILFWLVARSVLRGWLPFEALLPPAAAALVVFAVTRTPELVGVFALPLAVLIFDLRAPVNAALAATTVIMAHLFAFAALDAARTRRIALGDKKPLLLAWRTLVRPAAVLLVIIPFFAGREASLILTGGLAAAFLALDLVRLSAGRVNAYFFRRPGAVFKDKERRGFSSMTSFLAAVFILLLAFPFSIAAYAIVFLIFGDLAAKFFGLVFGRTRFLSKTLEGSLSYFAFAFAAGAVLQAFVPLPLWLVALGALAASVAEAFSFFGIDDNFSVGLVAAALMRVFGQLAA